MTFALIEQMIVELTLAAVIGGALLALVYSLYKMGGTCTGACTAVGLYVVVAVASAYVLFYVLQMPALEARIARVTARLEPAVYAYRAFTAAYSAAANVTRDK